LALDSIEFQYENNLKININKRKKLTYS